MNICVESSCLLGDSAVPERISHCKHQIYPKQGSSTRHDMKKPKSVQATATTTNSLFSQLPHDIFILILQHLPGTDLARLAAVNKSWKLATDSLWKPLVMRRWCVSGGLTRRLQLEDGRGSSEKSTQWKAMYENWEYGHRCPTSRYSGQRFPVFAKNSNSSKNSDKVGMWVSICPNVDCRMRRHGLRFRVVVQNLSDSSMQCLCRDIVVAFKDGTNIKYCPTSHVMDAKLLLHHQASSQAKAAASSSPKNIPEKITLDMYDFVIIELNIHLRNVIFEPEGLETMSDVRIGIEQHTEMSRQMHPICPCKVGHHVSTEAGCHPTRTWRMYKQIGAQFEDGKIWQHYERVLGNFWVFVDRQPNEL